MRLGRCLRSEARLSYTGLTQNQHNMPSAGFGDPGNVLAKHVQLKPPVNQRFLRAPATCLGPFIAAIIP
jgi:hypothetical protein